ARVRADPGRAVVEGRLRLSGTVAASVTERVVDAGSEPDEDGSVLLARTVNAEGRSRAHVGGRAVPVAVLGELGEQVVAVHWPARATARVTRPTRRGCWRWPGAPWRRRPRSTRRWASWPPG